VGLTYITKATCKFRRKKTARFGRKTGGCRKLFTILFRGFSIFRGFYCCKPLVFSDQRRGGGSKKNQAKKPTVGFWSFGAYGRIFIVRMKKVMQAIEGEAVARQRDCRCASVKKGLKFWHGTIPLFPAEASMTKQNFGFALRGGRRSLSKGSIGAAARAVLAGSTSDSHKSLIFNLDLRKSLIFKERLMQVVDFHDIFRYFPIFLTLFYKWQIHAWRFSEMGLWPERREL
jgi:hypothetical protein